MECNNKTELISREQVIFSVCKRCIECEFSEETFFQIKQAINDVRTVDLNRAIDLYLLMRE